jgi:hypothetical protein
LLWSSFLRRGVPLRRMAGRSCIKEGHWLPFLPASFVARRTVTPLTVLKQPSFGACHYSTRSESPLALGHSLVLLDVAAVEPSICKRTPLCPMAGHYSLLLHIARHKCCTVGQSQIHLIPRPNPLDPNRIKPTKRMQLRYPPATVSSVFPHALCPQITCIWRICSFLNRIPVSLRRTSNEIRKARKIKAKKCSAKGSTSEV